MNKFALTILTMLFCATAQSNTQHPGLTSNYDNVLQANIDDLNLSDTGITKKQLRGLWPHYLSPSRTLIDLGNIKTPVHTRFVNAGHYFSDQLIYGKDSKSIYELDVYVAKEYSQDCKYLFIHILVLIVISLTRLLANQNPTRS